ncbi:MAG: hypothetical protein CM15mV83_510 [uncultured marine virus]|nr:MAG: hypothetical protein CM15mV83_510 [uncultured marine virus]
MGSPLIPAAQQQVFDTISGEYLTADNPYFSARFNTAADAAQQKYFDAMNQINSQASMAGRYGSGAMADLQDRATSQFASALTDTAGQLAYDNYARERQNPACSNTISTFYGGARLRGYRQDATARTSFRRLSATCIEGRYRQV